MDIENSKTFSQIISNSNFIVRDHLVHGVRTLPGVTLLDMIYRLSAAYLGTEAIELKRILFKQPVVTSEHFDKNVFVTFTPQDLSWKVTITSQSIKNDTIVDNMVDENLECQVFLKEYKETGKELDVCSFMNNSERKWDMDDIYSLARKVDINHFEFMKTLGTVYQQNDKELMELHLTKLAESYRDKFYAHPAFLDGSTFAGSSFRLNGLKPYTFRYKAPYIPLMIERFCIHQPLPQVIYAYSQKKDAFTDSISELPDILSTNIIIYNELGEVLVEFDNLTTKRIRDPYYVKKLVKQNNNENMQQSVRIESARLSAYNVENDKKHPEVLKNTEPKCNSEHIIASYLQKEIGKVLGKRSCEIDVNTGFYDLGLDSTQLLNLVKELELKLNKQLYPTLLFEYSTIKRLSDYLMENYERVDLSCNQQGNTCVQESMIMQSPNIVNVDVTRKILLFESVWNRHNIIASQVMTPSQHNIMILYAGSTTLQASVQHAEILTLDPTEGDAPYRFETIFKQLFEIIKEQLRKKGQVEVLIQVVADSDTENNYTDAFGGLLKTAHLENPKIHGQIIKIDQLYSQSTLTVAELLRDEALSYEKGVVEIHYKGEPLYRYIKQLQKINFELANILPSFKENGVYVITGGLGGLGLMVANHIASQTKTKLVLIGRSRLNTEKEEKIRELMQKGSDVSYFQADISEENDMIKIYNAIKDRFGAIVGIFHCAGVLKDQAIIQKNLSDVNDVFCPKVQGLWNLDKITKNEKLDFFVIFSSISAIIGSLGQADYASANAFMDTFAVYRQEKVKKGKRYGKTITINWPLWSEGGMQVDDELLKIIYTNSGMDALPTQIGLKLLDSILSHNRCHTVVLYGEENKIRNYIGTYLASQEKEIEKDRKGLLYANPVTEPENNTSHSNDGLNDIAIIGLSGRYPGARTIEQFYTNLREGKDCITGFPKDRWNDYQFSFDIEHFYKYGGFIDQIDRFDPTFFNISPRQAEMMDPQARLFLETAWEACEDAGFYQDRTKHYYPSSGDNSVGVFAGIFWSHYELFAAEITQRGLPMAFGITSASIPNMVSYCLNFHGPSIAVDTMCSSSLTAMHLAFESIRKGECHYAIAGGVNLVTHPHKYIFLKQSSFLSSEGKCRSFGEGGDGYVPGEGVGAILLTTLERAEREGYHIYGIIKGSALNHVGKTSGATVPDPVAQSEVIADALKKARIDPRTISYIEAHGTGTSLGDPIEIQGLNRAFGKWTNDKQFCAIGSSKSNIGHLEAAAGIAGLTKVLLQLKHQELFPSLHSEKLNPYIPIKDTPFYITNSLRKWEQSQIEINGQKTSFPRRAGLSSFGANGSNAHIVIEEYLPQKSEVVKLTTNGSVIVPLSAKNEESLKAYAYNMLEFLKKGKDTRKVDFNKKLEETVRNEIIYILLGLIDGKIVDANQNFSELNITYEQLTVLHRIIQDKWGVDIQPNTIIQSQTLNNLVFQLLEQNKTVLKNQLINKSQVKMENLNDVNLIELAYTFQVGREAMACRAVFIVKSLEELIRKLELFIDGKEQIDGCLMGSMKKDKSLITVITSDEDMEEAIDKWIIKGKTEKLADLWVKGVNIDWNKLYKGVKPKRMSLPTYPFARERYWVPEIDIKTGSLTMTPLVDAIIANGFSEQRKISLLKKHWEFCSANETRRLSRTIAILSTQETRELATSLSGHLHKSIIMDVCDLKTQFQLPQQEWQNYDGIIDLVGYGREKDESLEWVEWLQQLIENGHKEGLMMLCVTKGLESYQNDTVNLSGASRVGLYRMLQSEYSHLKSRHMDADPSIADEDLVRQIVFELNTDSEEPEICYRNEKRYRVFLEELKEGELDNRTIIFPENQVLWITGGTRGLGYLCAQHFVRNYGVKRLVLTGKEALPPREQWDSYKHQNTSVALKIQAIQELEVQGVQVQVLSVPLTDEQAMQHCLQDVKRVMGPIGGVIHCAGTADRENPAFIRKSIDGIQQILGPKVVGLDVLYQSFKNEPLQFFVLFSSVSAIIPTLASGQSDYAMANAYMDYVAEAEIDNCPIVSIQWPSWKETGMGEVKSSAYQQTGLQSLTNAEGLQLLDRIIKGKIGPVVLPAVINPNLWKQRQLMQRTIKEVSTKSVQTRSAVITESVKSTDTLMIATHEWLKKLFSDELRMNTSKLDTDVPFEDYGVDSIMLAQISRKINQLLSEDFDPSIFYEYSTFESLTTWLVSTHTATLFQALLASTAGQSSSSSLTQDSLPSLPSNTSQGQASVLRLQNHARYCKRPYSKDIAVIGMSCRFPGASTLEEYWTLLSEGRSAIRPVPRERWGYSSKFYAGLLDSITYFDPSFFLIHEEDIEAMDPQALLVLQEALMLLCNAGYHQQEIKGKSVGVYLGGRSQHLPDESVLCQARNPIMTVGQNYLAANVSQYFDLRGPSMVVDTACSSALVCMHMAIQTLCTGEIDSAMVGGVSQLTTDRIHRIFEQRGILNNEPFFHIFDKRANGMVLGEGVGMVLLKTVEQALADGDHIYAVINSIAVNNDGRTAGPATPNIQAHKELMLTALGRSGRDPHEISYIETNGSGSEVTDLLELKAIQSIYRSSSTAPCGLGSIKPNIGHPLCAEGIASFIKVVLMMQHRKLVPFLSGNQPMTHYNMESSPFYFSRELTDWEHAPRIAAINCFADGGTNAHLIIEDWVNQASHDAIRSPIPPPNLKRSGSKIPSSGIHIYDPLDNKVVTGEMFWETFK
ncbi:SDR family NAD(P)-dependent oxidoreductase [Desulfosporosinus nitroreducens]|uniref:SDR family NAD(P)-dependent oxidoreductase n=1 Tax=Desulfosporosinus nitroreducens TaxID=2018668 RepID=UPI00207D5440|nr:SDR family NAD(P)-dependent oxidoreductase [Desulfosporosinus nitroreducens]MCO1604482.1 SDR family NAD(P)-dependent oxidoreductase [Desulfosporosinus nitroreducens]